MCYIEFNKKFMKNISKEEKLRLRTWVEIDRSAIKHNVNIYKKIIGKNVKLIAVVKSNAYGHGLVSFSRELEKNGIKSFATDCMEEATTLREAGIKSEILNLGFCPYTDYQNAIKNNITITISSLDSLKRVSKVKEKINIHIKVDTGMGRQGFKNEELDIVLNTLKKHKNINVLGVYSHLASADDLENVAFTEKQIGTLNSWHSRFLENGFKPIKHITASAGTMLFPQFHFDAVRIGIGLYGLHPSDTTKKLFSKKYPLKPVLCWKSILTEIKKFKKGDKIGYDLTETLQRDSRLAIIPVGYYNGYPRLLSLKGLFELKGKKIKIIGKVSMNMIIVDITDVKKAKLFDEVIIAGGKSHIADIYQIAQDTESIVYEVSTKINPIIKRYYSINPDIKRVVV